LVFKRAKVQRRNEKPPSGMAFQLVVDNPDLTGLKAGFDHIQPLF
jgi:hypothetical protein